MQRSSIIATVIAAGGVLIAGSVASVAVINAASSSQPDSETIQLVAAGSTATPSTQAPTPSQAASPAAALPTIEATPLPTLPKVEQPAEQAAAVQVAPATSGKAASKPSASKKPSDDSTSADSAAIVSVGQARSIVLKQGGGVAVVSTSKQSRQGYSTWAVRIVRTNGEELTGYVDRASGVVVDWSVNKEATPAAQPSPSASDDDDREDDSDDSADDSGSSDDHSGSSDDHDEDDD